MLNVPSPRHNKVVVGCHAHVHMRVPICDGQGQGRRLHRNFWEPLNSQRRPKANASARPEGRVAIVRQRVFLGFGTFERPRGDWLGKATVGFGAGADRAWPPANPGI